MSPSIVTILELKSIIIRQPMILPTVTCDRSVVSPSVCILYATFMHHAKAVGWKMSLGRDTHVVQSNTVLYRGPSQTTGRGDLGVETRSSQRCRLSQNYFGPCYYLCVQNMRCK